MSRRKTKSPVGADVRASAPTGLLSFTPNRSLEEYPLIGAHKHTSLQNLAGVRGRRPILMGRSNDLFGFTLCPTWASAKKSARPFTQLGQAPKSQHDHLPNLGKHQKNRFAICPTWASTKKTICHLPNLGKHQKIQFAICPTWASTQKTDLPFAQLGQAPKKRFAICPTWASTRENDLPFAPPVQALFVFWVRYIGSIFAIN